jgi:hypothetical protein
MVDSNDPRPAADSSAPVTAPEAPADGTPASAQPGEPADDGRFTVRDYVPPDPVVHFTDPADPAHRAERSVRHQRRVRRRRRRRIGSSIMLGAGILILAGSGWVAWRSYQAYSHLQAASVQVSTLQQQLTDDTSIDEAATMATIERLQGQAAAARAAVDDPVFRSATVLPFVGPNLDAVRQVSLTVDSLATQVMPSLLDVALTLRPAELAPTEGTINLEPIQRISPLLQQADDAVQQAGRTMAGIDRSAVLAPVGDAVLTLWRKLDQAAEVTEPGARIARLLPPMLGASAPRTYLVVFQNPAEPRATGGIFGSFAVVTADHGKVTIVEQGAASRTMGQFDPPAAGLTPKEQDLYGAKMARFPQDVNFSPDYPTAAKLFAEMYRQRSGITVDGVLAVDPVALSYTLDGAAPIDVGDGVTITAKNLVPVLLSTAYASFDTPDQSDRDAFLARATGKVFSELTSGGGKPRSILDGLRRAADERRVLIYSADPAEQADIAATGVSGALDQATDHPSIGVFLNDGTEAKLGYYLHNEVHVTNGDCGTDGRRELVVRVVLHYDAPADGLPHYVTGAATDRANTLRTNVLVFAPVGGGLINETQRDGAPVAIDRGEDHSREVGSVTVELLPGASTQLTFTVLAPPNVDGVTNDVAPNLVLTPGVTPWVSSVDRYRECRAPVA